MWRLRLAVNSQPNWRYQPIVLISGLVPLHALFIAIDGEFLPVPEIVQVGDGLARRHDEVVVCDPAPEQGREHIQGAFWLDAQGS